NAVGRRSCSTRGRWRSAGISLTALDMSLAIADNVGAAAPLAPRVRLAATAPRRLVVVSNRVGPIARGKVSHGGLAVALRAALEQAGGVWFGFSGTVTERPKETPHL